MTLYKPTQYGDSIGNDFAEYSKPVVIHVDTFALIDPSKYNVFIQIEPPGILNIEKHLIENTHQYNIILTWNSRVLAACKNAIKFPFGTCWVPDHTVDINAKKFSTSFLTSSKTQTTGHSLRHTILQHLPNMIRNVMPIVKHRSPPRLPDKSVMLKPFQFSIIVENVQDTNWFTEKLIDCLVCRTIPIYWGCPNINEYFNMDSIFTFRTYQELTNILMSLNTETYKNKMESIEDNYMRALAFMNIWKRVDTIIQERL